jgi:hypothetical protein
MEIPRRPLGTSGVLVSALGLGGYHVAKGSEREGIRIVRAAIDAGVTFMDTRGNTTTAKPSRSWGRRSPAAGTRSS